MAANSTSSRNRSDHVEVVGPDVMTTDRHCTYLAGQGALDSQRHLSDKSRNQNPYLYDVRREHILWVTSLCPKAYAGEWRCDNHPAQSRWPERCDRLAARRRRASALLDRSQQACRQSLINRPRGSNRFNPSRGPALGPEPSRDPRRSEAPGPCGVTARVGPRPRALPLILATAPLMRRARCAITIRLPAYLPPGVRRASTSSLSVVSRYPGGRSAPHARLLCTAGRLEAGSPTGREVSPPSSTD